MPAPRHKPRLGVSVFQHGQNQAARVHGAGGRQTVMVANRNLCRRRSIKAGSGCDGPGTTGMTYLSGRGSMPSAVAERSVPSYFSWCNRSNNHSFCSPSPAPRSRTAASYAPLTITPPAAHLFTLRLTTPPHCRYLRIPSSCPRQHSTPCRIATVARDAHTLHANWRTKGRWPCALTYLQQRLLFVPFSGHARWDDGITRRARRTVVRRGAHYDLRRI